MFVIFGEFFGYILIFCMKFKWFQGLDIRDGMIDFILYVSYGEMKVQEVVVFKFIMGFKNRFKKVIEVYL